MRRISVKGAVLVALWLAVSVNSVAVGYDYVHDPTHEGSITAGKVMTWQASPPGTILTWKVLNTGDIGWLRQASPPGAFKTTVTLSHTAGYHKGEFDGTYTVPGAGAGPGRVLTWYGSSDATVVYVKSVSADPAVIKMGEKSKLDATPNPSDAKWPGGKPEWDRKRTKPKIKKDPFANWAFSGIGDPMTMTFPFYGRWKVRATCGNSESTTVDVMGIKIGKVNKRVYLEDEFKFGFEGWAAGEKFAWSVKKEGLATVTQATAESQIATFHGNAQTSSKNLVTEIKASATVAGKTVSDTKKQEIHITVPHSADPSPKSITDISEFFSLDDLKTLQIIEGHIAYTIKDQHGDPLSLTPENKVAHYIKENNPLADPFPIKKKVKLDLNLKWKRNGGRQIPDHLHLDLTARVFIDPKTKKFCKGIGNNVTLLGLKDHVWTSMIAEKKEAPVASKDICKNSGRFYFTEVEKDPETKEVEKFKIAFSYDVEPQ